MKRKFCWLPTEIYSCKYYRDGFRWLSFVYVDDDGKHYAKEPLSTDKPRVRFDCNGRLVEASWPEGWHRDKNKINDLMNYNAMLIKHYNGE